MEAGAKIGASDQDPAAAAPPGGHSRDGSDKLPEVLDLTQAQNLRETVVARLNERSLVLDASAVERMSTPCAQILLAAGRAADLASCRFQILDASEPFRTALADLGLQTEFKSWMI